MDATSDEERRLDTILQEQGGSQEELAFDQKHEELVLQETWWWSVHICLCAIALFGNILFLVVVIYNRRRYDLKTFVTAVISTIAVLDVIDIARIIPVLVESLFLEEIFRHVYCTLGVFHELAVAIFLISLGVGVCVQAGRETKYYGGGAGSPGSDPRKASLPQKILIPIVLIVAAGAACPLFLLPYERLTHTCTDPIRVIKVIDTDSKTFYADLYSTIITAFTYVFPVLIIPLVLLIASLKTCISRQCCVPRFKQPIGELIMTTIVCLIYIATLVGVILPRIGELLSLDAVYLGPAPLLWEVANNAARPLCYFMMNPGVWDGLRNLCGCCCRKKHHLVNSEDVEEAEVPLAPVTTV